MEQPLDPTVPPAAKAVVVLGASPKPDRFAFRAMKMLKEHGFGVIPVNPAFGEILGERCHASIAEVADAIDTVTLYLSEPRSAPLIGEILAAKPRRIVFNPGAENPALAHAAAAHGIEVIHGCTLVMLQSGEF